MPGREHDIRLQIVSGVDALAEAAASLDALHDSLGSSVLVRRPWLEAWLEAWPDWTPLLVVVVDDDGVWRAAAPMAVRRLHGLSRIVTVGGLDAVASPVVSTDAGTTRVLVQGLVGHLRDVRGPWQLELAPVDTTGPLARELADQMPGAVVEGSTVRPRLDVGVRDLRAYVSANTRSSLARHRNRARRDGVRMTTRWVRDPDEVTHLLPTILDIHRERDQQLRGWSGLDQPAVRRHYAAVLDRHRDLVDVGLVEVDGVVAAYSVCVRDDRVLYVFDNRMNPAYAQLAPGLLANTETVARVVDDPTLSTVDWGLGSQRYKLSLANRVEEAVTYVGWSSALTRRVVRSGRQVRRLGRRLTTG